MKRLIIALGFFSSLMFLQSCNKQENQVAPSDTIVEKGVISNKSVLPFITKYDSDATGSLSVTSKGGRSNAIQAWTEFGPFSAPGTLTKLFDLRKTVLVNQPGLPTGVYFCDIYESKTEVTLPQGALMNFTGASKIGFSNYSDQSVGVNFTETLLSNGSKKYTFSTFSIVPRYTQLGQQISSGALPTDLTGITFNYSYLRNL